jgi:hypothetical protein
MKRILTLIADALLHECASLSLVFWILLLVFLNTSASSHLIETVSQRSDTSYHLSHKKPSSNSSDLEKLRAYHVENVTP